MSRLVRNDTDHFFGWEPGEVMGYIVCLKEPEEKRKPIAIVPRDIRFILEACPVCYQRIEVLP